MAVSESEGRAMFASLRPLCMQVMSSPSLETLSQLREGLKNILGTQLLHPQMVDYVLLPIRMVINKYGSSNLRLLEGGLDSLAVTLSHTRGLENWDLFHSLFIFLCMLLDSKMAKEAGFDQRSEDLVLLTMRALRALLLSVSPSLRQKLFSLLPALGHCVSVLLDTLQSFQDKPLRRETLSTLLALSGIDSNQLEINLESSKLSTPPTVQEKRKNSNSDKIPESSELKDTTWQVSKMADNSPSSDPRAHFDDITDYLDGLTKTIGVRPKGYGRVFASFLPGISMALTKLIMTDSKVGSSVTLLSLLTWSHYVAMVMNDTECAEEANSDKEKSKSVHSSYEKVSEMVTEGKTLGVKRTLPWQQGTDSKLCVLVQRMNGLVTSEGWKVRVGVVGWAHCLLTHCYKTLVKCTPSLLESMVALSNDDYPLVSHSSHYAITAFSRRYSNDQQSMQLTSLLEGRIHSLCSSLPRLMRQNDDKRKISTLQLLTGYLRLLGPHVVALTHSHIHLSRVVQALVQTLELQVPDTRIVEHPLVSAGTHLDQTTSPTGTHFDQTTSPTGTRLDQTTSPTGTRLDQTTSPTGTRLDQTTSPTGTRLDQTTSPTGTRLDQTTPPTGTPLDQTTSPTGTPLDQTTPPTGTPLDQTTSPTGTPLDQTTPPPSTNSLATSTSKSVSSNYPNSSEANEKCSGVDESTNQFASYTGSKLYLRFTHFREERIESLLYDVCQLLGCYGNIQVVIDHLVDLYRSLSWQRKEILVILSHVLSGIQKKQTDRLSTKELFVLVEGLILELVGPGSQNGVKEREELWLEEDTRRHPQDSVLFSCLLLNVISTCGSILGLTFEPLLQQLAYPLMQWLGDSDIGVRTYTRGVVSSVAITCGYRSIQEMITRNADYLVNSTALTLRNPDSLSEHLQAIHVLQAILTHGDEGVLPLMRDSLDELLFSLDARRQSPTHIWPALHTLAESCLRWSSNQPLVPPKKHTPGDVSTNQSTSVTEILKDSLNKKRGESPEHVSPDDIKHFFLDYHKQKSNEDNKESKEVDEEPQEEGDPYVQTRKLSPVSQSSVDVMQRCVHHLSSPSQQVRLSVLEALSNCLMALRNDQTTLLPEVHTVWSPFLPRLSDPSPPVAVRAWGVMLVMCEVCGGFLRKRVVAQVWPPLIKSLKSLTVKSLNADRLYSQTVHYKLQHCLLNCVSTLCVNLEVPTSDMETLVHSCLPYLSRDQAIGLQKTCQTCFQNLIMYDPDAIWLLLQQLCPEIVDIPSNDILKPFKFRNFSESDKYMDNVCVLLNFCM